MIKWKKCDAMIIDLKRFTKEKDVICPIVDRWGSYDGRKLKFNVKSGWYSIKLGNKAKINRLATPLEIEKTLKNEKSYIGYPIGEEFIPSNFDSLRRQGKSESIRYRLGNASQRLFIPARISALSDGRFYFYKDEPGHQRETLQAIKDCFDRKEGIKSIKGVTPEQRLLFILARLYQNSYEAFQELERTKLEAGARRRALEKFKLDFGLSLRNVISESGGTYKSHIKRNNGYLVEWEVGGQIIKSHLNDDMRIINAGFCLSGEDQKHSMSSLSLLAQIFQREEGSLYITRE